MQLFRSNEPNGNLILTLFVLSFMLPSFCALYDSQTMPGKNYSNEATSKITTTGLNFHDMVELTCFRTLYFEEYDYVARQRRCNGEVDEDCTYKISPHSSFSVWDAVGILFFNLVAGQPERAAETERQETNVRCPQQGTDFTFGVFFVERRKHYGSEAKQGDDLLHQCGRKKHSKVY